MNEVSLENCNTATSATATMSDSFETGSDAFESDSNALEIRKRQMLSLRNHITYKC